MSFKSPPPWASLVYHFLSPRCAAGESRGRPRATEPSPILGSFSPHFLLDLPSPFPVTSTTPTIGHHFACHLVREGYRRYREPSSGSHVKARERSMSYTSQRTTLIYMPSFRVTIVEYVLPLPCCDAPKAGSPSLCRVPLGLAQCLAVTFLFFQSTNVFGTH